MKRGGRHTLEVWLGSRLAVAVIAVAADRLARRRVACRFEYHWDVALDIKGAQYGYGGYPAHTRKPGRGVLPRAASEVGAVSRRRASSGSAAGLLVSAVAGTVRSCRSRHG